MEGSLRAAIACSAKPSKVLHSFAKSGQITRREKMQKIVKIPVGLPVAPGITENFSVFKSHTRFFFGEKKPKGCNLLNTGLKWVTMRIGCALRYCKMLRNRFFAIVHIFQKNIVVSKVMTKS